MTKEERRALECHVKLIEVEIKHVIDLLKLAEYIIPDSQLDGEGWNDAAAMANTRCHIACGLVYLQDWHRQFKQEEQG